MSQHDQVIANQAGAAFRADLNSALAALFSMNKGATEPAVMNAGLPWIDETTGLVKIRNSTNTAWITIGTLDEANLGLASLDGATFTGLVNQAVGANIASAATVNLSTATGNLVHITGTVATSAVTMNAGQQMLVIADGAWPLTYHATTNNISGGVSYTLAAGDMVLYTSDGTTVRGQIIKATTAGDYVSSAVITDTNFPATAVYGDLTSIALTPGDWDVTLIWYFNQNSATVTQIAFGLGDTSGNSASGIVVPSSGMNHTPPVPQESGSIASIRVNISAATTRYLKMLCAYSAGTPKCRGSLTARRIR